MVRTVSTTVGIVPITASARELTGPVQMVV